MALRQPANVRTILVVGAISALLLLVIVLAVDAGYRWYESSQEAQYDNRPVGIAPRLRDEQTRKLSEYRWVDESQRIVAVPVDRAMGMMLAEAATRPATQPR
jgi:hypothetical protein